MEQRLNYRLFASILFLLFIKLSGCEYFMKKPVSSHSAHRFQIGKSSEERTFTKCMMKCQKDKLCHSITYDRMDNNNGICRFIEHSPKSNNLHIKHSKNKYIVKEVYKEVKLGCKREDFVIHIRRRASRLPYVQKYLDDFYDSSVCLWFHTKRMPTSREALFAINYDSTEASCNAHFQLLLYKEKFAIQFRKDAPFFPDALIKPTANTWTHVCLLRRQTDDRLSYKYFLYVNATRVGYLISGMHDHSGERGTYIFNLGGELDVHEDKCVVKKEKKLFHGKIARVYMFNELLSYSEIQSLYRGNAIHTNPLIDWNEFRGTTDSINHYEHECEFEGNEKRPLYQ